MKKNSTQRLRARRGILGFLLCSVLMSFQLVGMAQNREITGKVVDKGSIPLPGVSVLVKGTTNGVATDLEGNFNLTISSEQDVLVFSCIGMRSRELIANAQNNITIVMEEDALGIEEVVVVGYGVQKKKDLSGSVASVSADDLSKVKSSNPLQALQGLAPGVSVVTNSGAPGDGATINIRGITTLNNNNPLYIIDGVPGEFSNLSNDDIESISILKDASAAAIYGARAAGGVIFVQTKRGKKNSDFKVNYSFNGSLQQVAKTIDMCDVDQYKQVYTMIAATDANKTSNDALSDAQIVGLYNPDGIVGNTDDVSFAADDYAFNYKDNPLYGNTDWQDAMFRTAWQQQHNLSIYGGGENSNISISANYTKQDGTMIGTDFERKGVRVNSDLKKGRLKVGESFSFTRKDGSNLSSSGYGQTYDMLYALPHMKIYNSDNLGGFGGRTSGMPEIKNPVGNALISSNDYSYDYLSVNGYAEIELIDGLKYKLNTGFSSEYGYSFYFKPKYFMSSIDQETKGSLSETRSRYDYWIVENLLTYNKTFGDHNVDALLGYSAEQEKSRNLTAGATGFNYSDLPVLSLGQDNKTVNSEEYTSAMASFFGRINYTYKDKYLLQANIRRDGSSKFGSSNRYGVFPSFSAAWRVSKEDFFSVDLISDLKLRASYGVIGNDRIGNYKYTQFVYNSGNYAFGNGEITGMRAYNLANKGIKWETTETTNIGIDALFLDNRLAFSGDYYIKNTDDILVNVTLPYSYGGNASELLNAASIKNSGIELMLSWRDKRGDFSYGVTGTFTTVKSEVTGLGGNEEPIWGGDIDYNSGSVTCTKVDGSISEFTVYKTAGIFQTQEEIDAYINTDGDKLQPNAAPGDIKFVDVNNDGVIDSNDKTKVGSPLPDFEYSISLNAAYKGFDIAILFSGVKGNEIFNGVKYITEKMNDYRNYGVNALNAWTPQNTSTNIPRAVFNDPNGNARMSERFVEDGSYFALKNIQVGYTLPGELVSKVKVDKVRIYAGANNLFTITDYSGYTPEIVGGNIFNRGIDYGSYPMFRNFNFGVEITF